MDWTLKKLDWFQPKGPTLFLVLDGMGVGRGDAYDAVAMARTPNLDRICSGPLSTTVFAHGTHVGLPSDSDMGNSEVGHNALGAGHIVIQGAGLVDEALRTEAIFESKGYQELRAAFSDHTLHFIGLLSDGGVHSRTDQLFALIKGSVARGARRVRVHILTDGRDVPDQTALDYVDELERCLRSTGVDARIASGGGRMYVTMDRYEADWSIVERGYRAHVNGEAEQFPSARAAIEAFRRRQPGISDQNLPPFVVADEGGPVGLIDDGDAVLCFNFRGDRVIELCRAFTESDFRAFDRGRRPDVVFAGMMEYDGDLHIPPRSLVDPPKIERTVGEWLVHNRVRTFAVSETQKFGHVTYFWNGNRSGTFDDAYETYQEIASDRVAFNEKPAMQAQQIADAVAKALRSGQYDVVRANLANGDMVGHTGDLAATITAVEHVDRAVGVMLKAVADVHGTYLVTADHGNADDMAIRDKAGHAISHGGVIVPRTSHTLARVPVCIGGVTNAALVANGFGLTNLTATHLNLLGFVAPPSFDRSLLRPI